MVTLMTDIKPSLPSGEDRRGLVTEDNDSELLPHVDEQGNILGAITRAEAHRPPQSPLKGDESAEQVTPCHPSSPFKGDGRGSSSSPFKGDRGGLLHPVVHLHVFNPQGDLYLQHRAKWKTVQPDRWDTATGGHIGFGESVADALAREVEEEIGLAAGTYTPELLRTYVYESDIERELVYVFRTTFDGPLQPSPTETQGGRFWPLAEIRSRLGHDVFTPMFEQEFLQLF